MLRNAFRRNALLVLLVTCFATTGCNLNSLNVLIPDFDASALDGMTLYRIPDTGGQPEANGGIEFDSVSFVSHADGEYEVLKYRIVNPDGSTAPGDLYTVMTRSEADPEQVQIRLVHSSLAPAGWYKVATHNAGGTSPLSSAQTELL